MSQVTLSIPDELLLALKATPDEFASRLRFAASVKLYEMGQLSSGGVDTFDLTEEELLHDRESA